ncbi:hypothetical protein [Paracoccus aestuariivivens]|uniref:hypothetical protein n=1 Tax=Paracoccus aestuariivivens TaxID=1820333 RepID=UPI001B8C8DFD|nr:hypothetical protein [Paracoccus aestuariivivens]
MARARRYLYRLAKYRLTAPRIPDLGPVLQGRTAVVVGSAPFSTRPAEWDAGFRVITINASQIAARNWLIETPDVTLMQFNQIEGQNPNALEVRRVLRGQSTGLLYMLHWRHDLDRLKHGLISFDYRYDQLRLMSRYERVALMHKATGKLNLELEADTKWSNGIVAAALSLVSGAEKVILTGINPLSSGHGYNAIGLARLHTGPDLEAMQLFAARGYPVFTADHPVAEATGLPLWTGG